jgi:hypothetical protein
MPIAINGSGTIDGISAGGLPDGSITNDDLAGSIDDAKLSGTTAKAWVNFNGTANVSPATTPPTNVIRASYNVSSITDNGTGDYTVNFATALADANYSVVMNSDHILGSNFGGYFEKTGGTRTASAVQLMNVIINGSFNSQGTDKAFLSVAIFR